MIFLLLQGRTFFSIYDYLLLRILFIFFILIYAYLITYII